MRFDGKVAFVTGGASGLGAAAAERFASEGARVVVADIDQEGAGRVAAGLPDALAVAVDTANPSSVQRAVQRAVDHYGRIDVVFNNAGIAGAQLPLHELPVDDWQQVRAVDGDGIFYVMKYCIAEMLRTGGGVIVNTSSTAGLTGQQNISPYTFAKAGIIGLTRSAAIEYAARNIRVNAIAPTVVWTPLVERFAQTAPDPAAMRAAMEHYNPMPGIPQAQDVAAVVAFLASDEARWITGHTLPIDGGYCAQLADRRPQAVAAVPSRGNCSVEKITSTGTSKCAAIRSARYRLGLYSPRSR
jgi:NAD(P)-dependent dehydrogenase (short-subunit alcohol dehydrogenase family)